MNELIGVVTQYTRQLSRSTTPKSNVFHFSTSKKIIPPETTGKITLKFSNFYIEPMIPTLCIKPFVGSWILKKRTEILNED